MALTMPLDRLFAMPWPIVFGLAALAVVEILYLLARWYDGDVRLHQLKVEAHALRLRLKMESAERLYEEERAMGARAAPPAAPAPARSPQALPAS